MAIPKNIKVAISVGIGLFLAFIGFQDAGLIVGNESTMVSLVDFSTFSENPVACWGAILAFFGIVLTTVLYKKKVTGSILISIFVVTILGIFTGNTVFDGFQINFGAQVKDFADVSLFACFRGFRELFMGSSVGQAILTLIMLIITFSMVDMFDTIGTLIGTAKSANMLDEDGNIPNAKKSLLCDAIATVGGSIFGTSTVTTYGECISGISVGGRTGLTSVFTAIMFLAAIIFAPFVSIIPSCATAPALIFVGGLLLSAIKDMEDPVLLSGTDGVGTKLKLAFLMDKHDTIGIDCVAMCVNDVACAGGEPLFFLDYIACGRNIPEKIATIVKGVAEGCKQSDAALVGGETAEHPGLMPEDEYDLAGFAVGVVERKDLITGENIKPGDVLVGIASSGVHSNGFSLVRKVFDMTKESLDTYYDELGKTLGEALLAPTRIYVKAMKSVKNAGVKVKGCSHITGGGFYENIPRMLPDGICAVVKKDSYEVPAIFRLMQKKGNIADEMMYNTYNMGLGMVLALDPADVDKTLEALKAAGETAYVVGTCEAGEKGVTIC